MENLIITRQIRGFSIIEIVVVLVLLGIVSVVVIPRFLNPNAVNDTAALNALLSTIRSAQQAALGRNSVTFEIATVGSNWVFAAKSAGSTIRTFEVPTTNVKLETGSPAAGSADSCASGTDFDIPVALFKLEFDGLGNLKAFTNTGVTGSPVVIGPTFNGVRICVNDTVEMSVCVSPAGYAYAGDCDD